MENKEILAAEQAAENVETTTEQTPKVFTEAEFNSKLDEVLGKKIARKEAKIRKEYEKKYGELEDVLKAGMGKEDVGEITNDLREFYVNRKGVKIPDRQNYSDSDLGVLARHDADDIISAGYDEVVEETDRLAKIGVANMSAREKALFKVLAEHRQNTERGKELAQIGVTEDVYNSEEFRTFAGKFNANTPIKDVYDIYQKTKPQKDIKPMGSMKNSTTQDGTVKDFYTREEALKFTKKDLDNNPALYKAIEASMLKW